MRSTALPPMLLVTEGRPAALSTVADLIWLHDKERAKARAVVLALHMQSATPGHPRSRSRMTATSETNHKRQRPATAHNT